MAVPIWKDHYVNLGAVDSIQYRIIIPDTGSVVYSGKAHLRPGETDINIRINDICADYLQHALPTLAQGEFTRGAAVAFGIQKLVSGTWTDVEEVEFYNDWSYDYGYDPATMGLSVPINGRVDSRMPILVSVYDPENVTAVIHRTDGTSFRIYIPVARSNDFNSDFNVDFSMTNVDAATGTAVILPSEYSNVESIEVAGVTYKVVTECARFALYYVNCHGGWDTFLIEGNHQETDSLKRYTMEMVYDNRNIQNRGTRNYVNEITKQFTLHTSWLFGDQGKEMHNIINSTEVYLYDISEGQMIPVIIPSNSCEYRSFKNNGNQLVRYSLQVQVAHNRIRR